MYRTSPLAAGRAFGNQQNELDGDPALGIAIFLPRFD
jgi:hypothetical protein